MTIQKIVDLHDANIRRFVINKYGAVGEDYLQEVYIKLSNYSEQKIQEISEKGYLLYLLHTMIKQQHVSEIRKAKEINSNELISSTESTIYPFEIDRLKLTETQCIFLEYYESGFSMAEISRIFKLNYKTVTNQLKSIPVKDA